ncbi:MAG: type II secretion system protein, partial [Sphaerotilus sp.]|nr:type II secretion system protein [Sphaerotilus sp.]
MKSRQAGFTMIELIVVIVILGVLAATAMPKFIDMKSDAQAASVAGVAGAAASAMNLNYAGCALTGNVVTANKCVAVSACANASSLLQGGLPTGYTLGGTHPGATHRSTSTCTVTGGGQAS